MRYEFHPEAEQEFIEAAAYYERNVTGLGERFGSEVRYAIERLLGYPELGSPMDADLRRLVLIRFPYVLIYSFTRRCSGLSPWLMRVVARVTGELDSDPNTSTSSPPRFSRNSRFLRFPRFLRNSR